MEYLEIKPNTFWYHFKRDATQGIEHGAYYVLGIGMDTEDRSQLSIIYKPLYYCDPRHADEVGVSYHVRPLDSFLSDVDREAYQGPRFVQITDPEIIAQLKETTLFSYPYIDDQTV